jgi:hypothetical protein
MDQGGLELAVGGGQGGFAGGLVGAGGLGEDPEHPAAELLVGRDQVDHQVRPGPAELDHQRRGERVQDHLLRGAGLQPGGARDHLGPGVGGDHDVGQRRQRGVRVRGHQHGRRPGGAGGLQGAGDVRRAPGSSEADDEVLTGHGGRVRGAALLGVLDVLDRAEQRLQPAGVVGDHQPVRDVERRQQLGGVQDRQASRRTGAEVVHPATAADRLDGGVHGLRQLRDHRADGARDQGVLVVHQLEDLGRAHRIDGQRPRVALLGR